MDKHLPVGAFPAACRGNERRTGKGKNAVLRIGKGQLKAAAVLLHDTDNKGGYEYVDVGVLSEHVAIPPCIFGAGQPFFKPNESEAVVNTLL